MDLDKWTHPFLGKDIYPSMVGGGTREGKELIGESSLTSQIYPAHKIKLYSVKRDVFGQHKFYS